MKLSTERAWWVISQMLRHLKCLVPDSKWNCGASREFPYPPDSACAQDPAGVWRYARERLWAVGSGDVQACVHYLAEKPGAFFVDQEPLQVDAVPYCDAKSLENDKRDNHFRNVTFELDVTGDDMTGFMMNVLELQENVMRVERIVNQGVEGSDSTDQAGFTSKLEGTAQAVGAGCWAVSGAYHGCTDFISYCLRQKTGTLRLGPDVSALTRVREEICTGFWDAAKKPNFAQRDAARRLCVEEPRPINCDRIDSL